MSVGSAYTQQLGHKIRPGLVCAGEFILGEIHLAVVTTADTVLLHSVTPRQPAVPLKTALPVTCIAAARFPSEPTDHLVLCTKTTILVYNVNDNKDVFRRDFVDGGNAVLFAEFETPMIVVGCNCSVQGYSVTGEEIYWAVTGDNVRSLAAVDMDKDGQEELLVGSEDYDIRVFKQDDLILEMTETQVVTHLHSLGNGVFAYALANGTVGVYERQQRLWRVKSKHRPTQMLTFDVNDDGVAELVTGWQGGKVDGRVVRTGEVIFKDTLKHTVAGLAVLQDRNHLVVVSQAGEVRGYHSSTPKAFGSRGPKLAVEQDAIRELFSRKQALLLELNNYQNNANYRHSMLNQGENDPSTAVGVIPARTRLQTSLDINPGGDGVIPHVQVSMTTNNDTCIRGVIVFAEGMFKGETQVKHPRIRDVQTSLTVALFPPRDIPIDIHIKAMVGYPDSVQLHVFELTRQLPKFSMYAILEGRQPEAQSVVTFSLQERVQRVVLWVNRHFLLNVNAQSELDLNLFCLRDGRDLTIAMDPAGKMTIRTDNMALAGDLIQSLAHYLNVAELKSYAEFPAEEKRCVELMTSLSQLENVKRKLNMELGSKSSLIRNLIIRAEDARLLGDYKLMARCYQQLQEVNRELQASHGIRTTNYNDSVATVRQLNNLMQWASRLRVGRSMADPVLLARRAITETSADTLIQAIRCGEA